MKRLSVGLCAFVLALVVPVAPAWARGVAAPTPPPGLKAPAPNGTPKPPREPAPKASPTPKSTPGPAWGNMQWRSIGPAISGGRVPAVAGTTQNAKLYYIGTAGGGVFKSTDGGETWQAVFEHEKVSAIGAVAIDPNNQNTVWAGTGESNPRNDVSYGDGIYKTTDGGKTWKNVGLQATRHISRIVIDPKNSNHVIVAAMGDVFKNSPDRGVYVTNDGGKTWSKTLYVGPQSGASDLAMDMQNPNVLYAGIWQFQRIPWNFHSGGPQDGLYKSTDGGMTWTRLTGHGLPAGLTGRIGLAVAPSNGNRVYALIEASKGILWRSDNAGATWTLKSSNTLVDQRPFYFTHIAVDPKNADKVYAVSEMLSVSTDGGKKFKAIADQVHVDYHAIWISPDDPDRIIVGEDGGDAITQDGGKHWFDSMNINIGQYYHVGLAVNENPYWVCAGAQDNSAWCGPSNSLDPDGILNRFWVESTGGDGEWAIPDPSDANYLWSDSENGALEVYNKVTQDSWSAQPFIQNARQQYDLRLSKYRFNWDSPIAFAPWNPHVAWYGGNVVFQSTDRGRSWSVISPDLTRNVKSHQIPSGGPITHDVSGAEYSDTILDIEGSPLHRGEIWVGTDDGLVQMTMDGGRRWSNVTPPGVAPWGRVENVSVSPFKDGTVYANIDRHRSGDDRPYLFVTHDFGRHWTSIVRGLPANQYVRSVRPDVRNANIVYAGTENGMWISFDGGGQWNDFRNDLPTVSVRDIRMQPQFDDLVIATHGRSLYVMDDMAPIQGLQEAIARGTDVWAPRTAYEYTLHSNNENIYTAYAAANPPYGAFVYFYQKTPAKSSPLVQILNARGQVIRTVSGTHKVNEKNVPWVTNKPGINRYVWDFQVNGPVKWYGAARARYEGPDEGPAVVPGQYAVRVTLPGHTYTEHFAVKPDPRSQFTQAEYVRTFALSQKYEREFSVVDTMLNTLDAVKKQLTADAVQAASKHDGALQEQIASVLGARERLFNQLTANYQNDEDSIQRPGALREDVESMLYTSQGLVTPPVLAFGSRVDREYNQGIAAYDAFVHSRLPGVDAALQKAGLKALSRPAVVRGGG